MTFARGFLCFLLIFLAGVRAFSAAYSACENQASARALAAKCPRDNQLKFLDGIQSLSLSVQKEALLKALGIGTKEVLNIKQGEVASTKACLMNVAKTTDEKDFCQNKVQQLRDTIAKNYSDMKVARSLMEPEQFHAITTPEDSASFKMNTKPKAYFQGTVDPGSLTDKEKKLAELIWDFNYDLQDEKYQERQKANMPKLLANAKNVPQRNLENEFRKNELGRTLKDFEEKEKAQYFAALEKAPVMAYLSTGNPSDAELLKALDKISAQQKQADAILANSDKLSLLEYPGMMEIILNQYPEMCAAAESLHQDFVWQQRKDAGIHLALAVGPSLGCLMATGPFAVGCFIATGASTGGYDTWSAYKDNKRLAAMAFSSASGSGLANTEQAGNAQDSLHAAGALAVGGTALSGYAGVAKLESAASAASKAEAASRQALEEAKAVLDKAGIQYSVATVGDGPSLVIQGSDASYIPQLAQKFKDRVIFVTDRRGTSEGYTTSMKDQVYVGFPPDKIANGRSIQPTVNHEFVHVTGERQAIATGENPGLVIDFKVLNPEKEQIPTSGYSIGLRADEVKAFYKGAKAADDLANKATDPVAAQAFKKEAAEYRDMSTRAGSVSNHYLEDAVGIAKQGKIETVTTDLGHTQVQMVIPGSGGYPTVQMSFLVKPGLSGQALQKEVQSQIKRAMEDVTYYRDRVLQDMH